MILGASWLHPSSASSLSIRILIKAKKESQIRKLLQMPLQFFEQALEDLELFLVEAGLGVEEPLRIFGIFAYFFPFRHARLGEDDPLPFPVLGVILAFDPARFFHVPDDDAGRGAV